VDERLQQAITDESIEIAPLYGALQPAEQDRAIAPARPGRSKVVLATSIAETSLTIEGIQVVVDSGLSRVPRYEPGSGLTRLETVRSSRAAIEQRRGRAGRLGPGVCYRLWSEPETQSLPAFDTPEIANADLSRLIMDCAVWGVADPGTLDWLDSPPPAALATARAELVVLGALETDGRLSPIGKSAAKLPLPPRLAMMLLRAASAGRAEMAAEIAAVLVERGLGGSDTDLETRLSKFRSDRSRRARDMTRLAGQWARIGMQEMSGRQQGTPSAASAAAILALAYPDRLAKARGTTGQYLLANGRGAQLGEGDPLMRADYLVVADMTGAGANGRIRLAAAIDEAELRALAGDRIKTSEELSFDAATGSVRCRRVVRLDAIVLSSEPRPIDGGEETEKVLCQGIVALGISRLPWNKGQQQLRERVAFLRRNGAADLPDLGDAALSRTVDTWLLPFLAGKTALSLIGADDLGAALGSLVDWHLRQRIDAEAPSYYEAPTGTRHPIDYSGPLSPSVAIRVQELFGARVHPTIGDGRVPLTLELLSPARRPIQITRDLAGFWVGSWKDVRSQLRGRYPKHFWPENAAEATPTTRTKSRMAD
jgi:ATP-dependent helicase HrpB